MINVIKRLSWWLTLLVFIVSSSLASVGANGISEEQRQLFRENINYFNIDTCSASPAINSFGAATSNKVYVVGDSLTVGMRDSGNLKSKLSNAGWDVTGIEATGGISIDASIPKVKANANEVVSQAGTVVVGLGTNRSADPGKAIDSMIDTINQVNATAKIDWINAYSTDADYSDFNQLLDQRVKSGKINKVLDWAQEARSNPGTYNLAGDPQGIHTGPAGYIKRSEWVVNQLGKPPASGGSQGSQTSGTNPATGLSGDQKISATFMVGFNANTPKSTIENVVQKYKIGGIFIIGTNNAAASGFTKSFFAKLNKAAGHNLVIASDDESSVVHRYQYPFDLPSANDMGKMSDSDVQELGQKVAKTLSDNGVNTDLAPILDVSKDSVGTDAGTKERAFSNDPDTVTAKAGAFAAGLRAGGINPVYKHFPGLGSTSGNSDNGAVTTSSLDSLKNKDLKPFESLANKNGAAVMMDNAHVPGLTDAGEVASTSSAAVKLLRNDYAFKGLIMTDDLTAAGVPVAMPLAVSRALQAGADMPLFSYKNDASIDSAIAAAKSAGVSVDSSLQTINDFASSTTSSTSSGSDTLSCCPPGGSSTLTGNSNAERIWNYFIKAGLNNVQVAAIMGNLQQESAFSPTIVNPSSGAYGIGQWLGGRLTSLKNRSNYSDLLVQLNFMWSELGSSYKKTVLEPLKKTTNLSDAVKVWLEHYEIPCTPGSDACAKELKTRLGFATTWLNKANGGAGADAAAVSIAESNASGCSDSSGASGIGG